MKRVDTYGLYHYEITGDREEEAAAEFEKKYDDLFRSGLPSEYLLDDLAAYRHDISEKYGVEIRAVV